MKITAAVSLLLVASGLIFCNDSKGSLSPENDPEKGLKKEERKKETKKQDASPEVSILEKWDLPERLREVSGIAYLDGQRFACIQDEEGTIFVYNTADRKVEQEIPFAGPGDYEGIAVNGATAYVVRADGRLYEVDMKKGKSSVQEYKTPLTAEHNIEGLCYDGENNRLLLAEKDGEPGGKGLKKIYAFDLSRKTLQEKPVFQIDPAQEVIRNSGGKKEIRPSAIGIHPQTKEIYVMDGPKSRLLVMDKSGNVKALYQLGKEFAQPEGISFSPEGKIFISNEGKKQPGNIMEVKIK